MISGKMTLRRFPPLPRLKSIVTVASRPGGTWSTVRDMAAQCEATLILDLRTDMERKQAPSIETLSNLALMNKMGFSRASDLLMPDMLLHEIRRPLTTRRRGLPVLNDLLFGMYVEMVLETRRAFDPGKAMEGFFYGEHRGIVFIGSPSPWWEAERLYLHCLLEGLWPTLRIYHV